MSGRVNVAFALLTLSEMSERPVGPGSVALACARPGWGQEGDVLLLHDVIPDQGAAGATDPGSTKRRGPSDPAVVALGLVGLGGDSVTVHPTCDGFGSLRQIRRLWRRAERSEINALSPRYRYHRDTAEIPMAVLPISGTSAVAGSVDESVHQLLDLVFGIVVMGRSAKRAFAKSDVNTPVLQAGDGFRIGHRRMMEAQYP